MGSLLLDHLRAGTHDDHRMLLHALSVPCRQVQYARFRRLMMPPQGVAEPSYPFGFRNFSPLGLARDGVLHVLE